MTYFLVTQSEDGIHVNEASEQYILDLLNDGELDIAKALARVNSTDPYYWGDGRYLIVRGEAVVPVPKKIVTQVELP